MKKKNDNTQNILDEDSTVIDKIFDEVKEQKLKKVIKQRKRVFIIKNIVISTISMFICLIVSYFILDGISARYGNMNQNENINEINAYYEFTYPNRYIGETRIYDHGWFKSTIEIETYKNIGGRIQYAGPVKRIIGINTYAKAEVLSSGLVVQDNYEDGIKSNINDRASSSYGLRYMTFFYPYVEYKTGINDMKLLRNMSNDKVVEVAISFDKMYSPDEVSKIIPEEFATFYWIDDKTEDDKEKLKERKEICTENNVHGIKLLTQEGIRRNDPEGWFINAMNNIESYDVGHDAYKKLYERIAGDDNKLQKADIRVNGVVLVGSPNKLLEVMESPIIRYATLGTVVDKY